MTLSAGDRLGPYEVLAPLGAGGMGEVYKARDTRLDRAVAVKVLPEHIAQREDARARFEREARAVASLNHPNICTLHDIGPNYMVMELIEGETLAARIAKGPIPIEQAITLATQIADALDRAHRAGVTHRDIKPGNIMLTRDGAKVLDFGLAKSTPTTPGPTETTLTKALTTEGTVVGTPQYMAPEQFEGREADARSDIWAFGAVLYEMITGRKAFEGKSYTSLVAAILAADPAPMAVQPFTPAWLERLVRRCLAKDPDDRWQSMRDLVLDLKSPPPVEVAPAEPKSNRWPWAVVAVAVIAAVAFAGLWLRGAGTDSVLPATMDVIPPEGGAFSSIVTNGGSAISPDGRTLAFVATNDKGQPLLHVRPLDSLASRALPGTEDAGRPFWSPDSKSLAFVAAGKLKRIDLAGGMPVSLCDANLARSGDWNEAGVILFARGYDGIFQIPASGGIPKSVTRGNGAAGETRQTRHYYPQFLPGGREFLYLVRRNDPNQTGIAVGSLDRPLDEAKPSEVIIARTQYNARYDAKTGRLLYVMGEGTLVAQRMELNPPRLVGEPSPVADGLQGSPNNGYADFSISRNGTLSYRQGTVSGGSKVRLGWRDRAGKPLETIGESFTTRGNGGFSLSPDGKRVAYNAIGSEGVDEVWVMDVARGLSTRISRNVAMSPHWSPDGKFLYYNSAKGICRRPADGSGEETLLAKDSSTLYSVSPDGRALLFAGNGISRLLLEAGEAGRTVKREVFLNPGYSTLSAAFSPDGRWVAYRSNESGRYEIFVTGYPAPREKTQVSGASGIYPSWRPDGRELYWSSLEGIVTAAGIELGPESVRVSRAETLFRLPQPDLPAYFQPSRDGQRFLVYEPESGAAQQIRMVVVQNWAARLGK